MMSEQDVGRAGPEPLPEVFGRQSDRLFGAGDYALKPDQQANS